MSKSRKILSGLLLGFIALALAAGVGFTALGQTTVSAATAQQTTPTPGTTPNANKKGDLGQFRDGFVKSFASRLGVDEAKLNTAFTGAVDDTLAQAVKDGKLTQAQADKIKEAAKNGFQGNLGGMGGFKGGHGPGRGGFGDFEKLAGPTIEATAKTLGMTTDELKAELKAGKSIATVAQAKNVPVQQVKDTMLASIKTQLDGAVKDGKLTQAQADMAYQMTTTNIDRIINASHPQK